MNIEAMIAGAKTAIALGALAFLGLCILIPYLLWYYRNPTPTATPSGQAPPPPTPPSAVSGGTGGQQPPTPTPGTTPSQHEPADPAPAGWRWFLFLATELLLFMVSFLLVQYVLSKVTTEGLYVWIIASIGWVILSVLAFKLFFRTVGVYQIAHTQSLIRGSLRRYGAGTNLLLPWETLTEDRIVDTEVKVVEFPATRVTAGDGSPFDATGQIRYHVDPTLSHRFIGVRRTDLEKSLVAIAMQITREETARHAIAEELIKHLPDTVDATGNVTTRGIISTIEYRFMNGANVTRIEGNHGIEIDGVPISLVPAKETEEHFLKRFEDLRLAESAKALQGLEEQARLALLNNPDANFSHTVSEEKQTGERTLTTNVNVSGTSGESLKDIAATATIIAQAFAVAKQQKGGGQKLQKQQKQQKPQQNQTGGQTP